MKATRTQPNRWLALSFCKTHLGLAHLPAHTVEVVADLVERRRVGGKEREVREGLVERRREEVVTLEERRREEVWREGHVRLGYEAGEQRCCKRGGERVHGARMRGVLWLQTE